MFLHKNIRLNHSNYLGKQAYFVTICCSARRKTFSDPQRCQWLLDILRAESVARGFAIHAYCIMPDHLHFLAEGMEASRDLLSFIKSFKLKTSRAYHSETSQALWQKKFYDHILRSHESLESVAWYIWMNPVRKRLSDAVAKYPFAGSFTRLSTRMPAPAASWAPPWTADAPASEGGRYNS